jgi:acyl dehydratase
MTSSSRLKEALYELVEVPEQFGPIDVHVDAAKVRNYAFAQGDYGSWYFRESPFGHRIAHPLILANDLLFLFYDKYDGNTAQGLHTHEKLVFESPIHVGETVTVSGAYTEKYEKRGQGYVVLEAEARGEDGRVVTRHIGREIMRTVAGDIVGNDRSRPQDRSRTVRGRADPGLPVAERAQAQLSPGTPIAALTGSFDQDQMSTFSWAGRGYSNVHTSLEKAAKAGLDQTIVQAQQQTGLLVQAMVSFFGAAWFKGGELDLRFVAPLFVDEEVTTGGAVLGDHDGRLELEVWAQKNDGTRTALGWASADLDGVTAGPVQLL